MKELNIELEDGVFERLVKEGAEYGLTEIEYAKFLIGNCVRPEPPPQCRGGVAIIPGSGIDNIIGSIPGELMSLMKNSIMGYMRQMAERGELNCSNCTMKITLDAIDDGKCGACGTPIKEALKGQLPPGPWEDI